MSRHEDDVRLTHMLDHAREAVDMCRGRARADLDPDRMLNLALVRLVEILGMRNRIVHGYDEVNFDILRAVIHDDLPPLIEKLKGLLGRA